MKITGKLFTDLESAIKEFDTVERRNLYINRDPSIPRLDKTKDINMRYRWDAFYLGVPADLRIEMYGADPSITDAHVDTALRRIIKPLI